MYVCVYYINGASLLAQTVKNPRAKQETWVRVLDWEDPLEKEMAACRGPAPADPGYSKERRLGDLFKC